MHIELHPFRSYLTELVIKGKIEEDIPYYLQHAIKEFRYLYKESEEILFFLLRNQPENHQHIKASLLLILQAHWVRVYMLNTQKSSIDVRINNQIKSLVPSKNQMYQQDAWLLGYYYALICRSKTTLPKIKSVNGALFYGIGDIYSAYNQAYFTFLKELGKDKEQDLAQITIVENIVSNIPLQYSNLIRIPIPLWRPLIEGSKTAFNEALSLAIQEHKKIWSGLDEYGEDQSNNIMGHYNLALTAIMSYAYDQGIPIEITSDYTPQALVEGNYQMDVDTELDFYFGS